MNIICLFRICIYGFKIINLSSNKHEKKYIIKFMNIFVHFVKLILVEKIG